MALPTINRQYLHPAWIQNPSLQPDTRDLVQVFSLRLDHFNDKEAARLLSAQWGRYAGCLDGNEKFQRQQLAALSLRYFVVSRLLGAAVEDVAFHDGRGKKLELARPAVTPPLYLSQSHTDRYLMLAVSPTPCGVDVENLRRPTSYPHILEKAFPPAWRADIDALPPESEEAAQRFTAYWTALEAWYKLRGTGSFPSFLRSVRDADRTAQQDPAWEETHLYPVQVDRDYWACLALVSKSVSIQFCRVESTAIPG
ncbi:MAG: 4'-phosphopantetheinyl transferase family protein [Candidatus Hydrogenedentales bacterium]|jgi:phosphopantetheinyl transferase